MSGKFQTTAFEKEEEEEEERKNLTNPETFKR